MEMVRRYRSMGRLCRQQAVFNPEANWRWLGEAQRWEDLADSEVNAFYQECNASDARGTSSGVTGSGFVTSLMQRSTPTPISRPTATSVNQ
jgi:hypothetical protein